MTGLSSVYNLEMFGIAENVKKFLIDSMQTWKVELSSSGESLEVIHIRGTKKDQLHNHDKTAESPSCRLCGEN